MDVLLVILFILQSVTAIIYLALGIYGFRVLKADWALAKKTEKISVQRPTLIGVCVACIFLMGQVIAFAIHTSEIISDEQTDNIVLIVYLILFAIGAALEGFSFFRVTIQSLQSMALAEAGIVATRNKWLIFLQKYGALTIFLISCAVGAISLIATSDVAIFGISLQCFVSVVWLFLGFLFGFLSYKFRLLAENETSTNPEEQCIPKRCREIQRLAKIFSICFFLAAIVVALTVVMTIAENIIIADYLLWAINIIFTLMVYIIIGDASLLTTRNEIIFNLEDTQMIPVQESTPRTEPPTSTPTATGIAITNKDQRSIGTAPHAPRPSWLPTNGTGQANVTPDCWSISLENWVRFIKTCMATTTWSVLAETKGIRNINMYDVNAHFIKPWTSGTGCSVAGLMDNNQGPVDLMVSHAWAGSVIESLASIKTITTMYLVPKDTRIFFDTVCLYQAEDGTIGGLSIPEQLTLKPFTTIIHQKPHHGMFIIHTTISEVYERLWCVHEADEAVEAKIGIYGAFDPASWNTKLLKSIVTSFSSRSAECQGESDKEMLTDLINARGGFDRLDSIVRDVRKQSIKDLEAANLFEQLFSMSISSVETFDEAQV